MKFISDDFKPLSVDHSKPGKLRVGEGDEVNMSLPVVQVCATVREGGKREGGREGGRREGGREGGRREGEKIESVCTCH